MSDPFGLISIAAARGGGSVDGYGASQLVAAGQTLLQRSAPLVRALMGKRSAILLPPSHQFFTALAASDGRGAVLINPLAAPAEVAFQLTDAEVGATFTSRALAAKLPPDAPRVYLDDSPRTAVAEVAGDIRTIDLGSHVGLAIEGDPDVPGSDDEAVVVYTSAMAGLPLGAVLTHRNLLANLRSSLKATDASPADHALAVIPFAHLFGLVVSGLTPLLSGAKLTCMERFHPVRAIDAIEELGISVIVGVPAIFASLTIVLERRGEGLRNNRLRVCICGGAPLEPTLQERWFELTGVELRQGYGLTEAGPVCLFNTVQRPNRRGTMGYPLPDVDVEIHSPETGAAVPDETVGEIWVAGDNVSPGYVRGIQSGLARHGRWLRTGDLGTRHADGVFSFKGLMKAMFTRGGFNIYPSELERVIGAMPGVRGVAVRAIPDPSRENEIAVDITGDVAEADVKRWCEAQLSAYKVPSVIVVHPPN